MYCLYVCLCVCLFVCVCVCVNSVCACVSVCEHLCTSTILVCARGSTGVFCLCVVYPGVFWLFACAYVRACALSSEKGSLR